ncbi:hypothetical protein HY636_05315 [Candidatus Woesearchaeota archaeon]|nr:hypothetical protein [Candidatus Woesearchaeota archaeon]
MVFNKINKKPENKVFNKKNVIGIIIVFVMVSSLLAVWQGSSTSLDNYNHFRFRADTNNKIFGKMNDNWIQFNYHPSFLEKINVSDDVISTLNNSKMIYITFEPTDKYIKNVELMRFQIRDSFLNEFNMYPFVGVTNNTGNYQALPFIDCNNATQFVPVIYIKSYNETLILNENNCIYLYASGGVEFNAILDRIRYGLYGVMK